jgi:hypothetical protein
MESAGAIKHEQDQKKQSGNDGKEQDDLSTGRFRWCVLQVRLCALPNLEGSGVPLAARLASNDVTLPAAPS